MNGRVKFSYLLLLLTVASLALLAVNFTAYGESAFGPEPSPRTQPSKPSSSVDDIIKNANRAAQQAPSRALPIAPPAPTVNTVPTAKPLPGDMRNYLDNLMNNNAPAAENDKQTPPPVVTQPQRPAMQPLPGRDVFAPRDNVTTQPAVKTEPRSDNRLWGNANQGTQNTEKTPPAVADDGGNKKGANDWSNLTRQPSATTTTVRQPVQAPTATASRGWLEQTEEDDDEDEDSDSKEDENTEKTPKYEPDYSLPPCAASTVKRDPLGSLSLGVQLYNSVYYDASDYKQVQKAKNSKKHVVAYNPKAVDYDYANPNNYDFWSEFAVISGVECLPTSVEFVQAEDGNYLETRTGAKVWE
ncbi:MAG: hypothetical protein IT292_04675 [Deltaproteobacteria bacterium]|nr:hypothetical protein [Deltaproteobacteria bacterium]